MKKILILIILITSIGHVFAQSGLVAQWKLNNNLTDASGNSISGTNMNGASFTTSSKEGSHALLLNGTNQYIDFGNPAILPSGTSPRTITAWAKTTLTQYGSAWIVAYGSPQVSKAMFIGRIGNQLCGGSYASDLTVSNFWAVDVWHHIALTYDGTTARLYADGNQVNSQAMSWSLIPSRLYIGRQVNDAENWQGSVDDVRIYNRALTATEIQGLAGALPPTITPPSNLAAATLSQSQISLTWTDNSSNETGFQVERSTTSGSGYSLVGTAAANATSYINTGLTSGTTYYFRIRSINASASSGYTSQVSATTLINPNPLVAHWRFNGDLFDASGNEVHGANVGATFATDTIEGDKVISFNGTNQYVDFGNSSVLPSRKAARTMAAWIKTNSITGGYRFAVAYGTAVPRQAMFIGQNNGTLQVGAYGDDFQISNGIQANTWKHVCLTYDGTTAKVYINGVLSNTMAKDWDLIPNKTYIGRQVSDGEYWNGSVDDVRIYNKALTAAEVLAITKEGKIPDAIEFAALKNIYDSLGGAGWTSKANWPTTWPISATNAEFAGWQGVTVAKGDVVTLSRNSNNLAGTIPTTIGNLQGLKTLQLIGGSVSGHLPKTLGKLRSLEILQISDNNVTGPIPEEIGGLISLKRIFLINSKLEGSIPVNFNNLVNLEYLYLYRNNLSGNIPYLGNLVKLIALAFHRNDLTGNFDWIGNMPEIRDFYFYGNPNLQCTIPASIGNLKKMTTLAGGGWFGPDQYVHSKVYGPIPSTLNECIALQNIYLDNSEFSGTIPSLSNLSNLKILAVFNNPQLNGDLGNILNGLVNVTNLHVNSTGIGGILPSSISSPNLTILDLSNSLVSELPGNLSAATNLNTLKLSSLGLQTIPNWSGSFPVLIKLDLSHNKLTSFADLTTHPNAANLSVDIRDNNIAITDIEKHFTAAGINVFNELLYENQTTLANLPSTLNLLTGKDLIITAPPAGTHSVYTWEKLTNGTWQDVSNTSVGGNPNVFRINNVSEVYSGKYRCTLTNSWLPNIHETLEIDVIIQDAIEFASRNLTFQYRYDARKRMTHKKVPGAEWVYMVYDKRDRLVMTQDGVQRNAKQWSYTKYDELNRPIITGIYTHSEKLSQEAMTSLVENSPLYEIFDGNISTHGYSNTTLAQPPFITQNFEPLTVTYYDDYAFRSSWGSNYDYQHLDISQMVNGEEYKHPQTENLNVIGQPTGSKIKTLTSGGNGIWLKSVAYFDSEYRVVQSVVDNALGGMDRTSTVVDFVGKVLVSKTTHQVNPAQSPINIKRTLEYDHAGRPTKTWHQINEDTRVLISLNRYNELGQLIDKKLHSKEPNVDDFKQSIDYRYNIRGWLTSINNAALQNNTSTNDDTSNDSGDLFGMDIAYQELMPGMINQTAQFNGNIAAIAWSSPMGLSDQKQRGYTFGYDNLNRLTTSFYKTRNTVSWNNSSAFREYNFLYDLNGNILELDRTGENGTIGGVDDKLKYTYTGNRLISVKDEGSSAKGFVDGNLIGEDYSYDDNGNLTKDTNKGITLITYNHLNLPSKVTKSTGDYLTYAYDASGKKIQQTVFNASGLPQKKSDYSSEFFYENGILQYINHEEGRIVNDNGFEYQYNHKDHLGNVRMTFTSKEEIETNRATLEDISATDEGNTFLYYDEAVIVKALLFDHTHKVAPTNSGTKSTRLLGGNTTAIFGLAKSLSVMPGDVIHTEVYAKYVDRVTTPVGDFNTILATIANASVGSGIVVDGGGPGSLGGQNLPFTPIGHNDPSNGAPRAYLNYIVFGRNIASGAIDMGYVPITQLAGEHGQDGTGELLAKTINIKEPGYVYVYLSNENPTPTEVYFDDFEVNVIKSPIIQTDDYYPFGLSFNSYRRENSLLNKYQYNSKELQDDLNVQWYDYQARQYDPVISRFLAVDPASDEMRRMSTYSYAFNNPMRFIDPDGMLPSDQTDPKKGNKNNNPEEDFVTSLVNYFIELGSFYNKMAGNEETSREEDALMGFTVVAQLMTAPLDAQQMLSEGGAGGKSTSNKVDDAVSATKGIVKQADNLVDLGTRAKQIHQAVVPATQRRTTIAVASAIGENGNSVRIVGSNEPRLRPIQRAALAPGEIEAVGPGHAEATILNFASQNGYSVQSIGASRPICQGCAWQISNAGVTPATPLKQYKGPLKR